MEFTRGIDPKHTLDIGEYHLAEEIFNVRILKVSPEGAKFQMKSDGTSNLVITIPRNESDIHQILEDLAAGKYERPDLLEITLAFKDSISPDGTPVHFWSLGDSLKGSYKYKGKLYRIPGVF